MKAKSKWLRHAAGVAIALLSLFLIARQTRIADVIDALESFRWPYLILGVGSLGVGYTLRISRWSMMLRAAGAFATMSSCAKPFLASIALNNVLPLRLGDLIRAFVFPAAMGISRSAATGTLLLERLIDLLVLLSFFAIGLATIQTAPVSVELKQSAVAVALGAGLILATVLVFSGIVAGGLENWRLDNLNRDESMLARALAMGSRLLRSVEAITRPRVLLLTALISVPIWLCESGLFYFVLNGSGIKAGLSVAMLVTAVATLSTLVPSTPGYVGPFHLAAFTAVSLVGGSPGEAASFAVLAHLALWLPTTVVGALAIWTDPSLFRAARSASDSLNTQIANNGKG